MHIDVIQMECRPIYRHKMGKVSYPRRREAHYWIELRNQAWFPWHQLPFLERLSFRRCLTIFSHISIHHCEPSEYRWISSIIYLHWTWIVVQMAGTKKRQRTFNMSGLFQGPSSERMQPPLSAQVHEPPRNSGISLVKAKELLVKDIFFLGKSK